MQTLTPLAVTPAVLALFDMTQPTMPRAFNVLEGVTAGQIVVDDAHQPQWAVVPEATYNTLYFGGQLNATRFTQLIAHFRQAADVGIGCWLEEPYNNWLPPNPEYDGRTLYFAQRSPEVSLTALTQSIPPAYTLAIRDEHLLAQSPGYASTLASFGSVENILRQTLGMVICVGETVVCEAATGAPTRGRIEVGVTTLEEHRRLGLATIACVKLIEVCEARGYATWWDCAKQNTPSVRLAHTLGFQNPREYRYVWYAKNSTHPH